MKPTLTIVLVIFTFFACRGVQTGPSNWAKSYPSCGGLCQSPNNIEAVVKSEEPRPAYNYYSDTPSTMTLENSGNDLKLSGTFAAGKIPNLKIRSKRGKLMTYELDSLHFHWGKIDSEGSDHAFMGRRYPMEMHMVHLRVKDGVTVVPNEIVVLGYVFKISPDDNPGLAKMLSKISDVKNPETTTLLTPFPWSDLAPEFSHDFYLYSGSLTVPPCSENVSFFLRKRPALVSSAQMEKFRSLLSLELKEMSGNFRPIQKLNGRTVYYIGKPIRGTVKYRPANQRNRFISTSQPKNQTSSANKRVYYINQKLSNRHKVRY